MSFAEDAARAVAGIKKEVDLFFKEGDRIEKNLGPDFVANFQADRSGESKNRIVSAAKVQAMLQLAAVTVVVKVLPQFWVQKLRKEVGEAGARFVAKLLAKKLAKSIPVVGDIADFIGRYVDALVEGHISGELEKKLRAVFAELRKELNEKSVAMPQVRKDAVVKDVRTRHKTRRLKRSFKPCHSR